MSVLKSSRIANTIPYLTTLVSDFLTDYYWYIFWVYPALAVSSAFVKFVYVFMPTFNIQAYKGGINCRKVKHFQHKNLYETETIFIGF